MVEEMEGLGAKEVVSADAARGGNDKADSGNGHDDQSLKQTEIVFIRQAKAVKGHVHSEPIQAGENERGDQNPRIALNCVNGAQALQCGAQQVGHFVGQRGRKACQQAVEEDQPRFAACGKQTEKNERE